MSGFGPERNTWLDYRSWKFGLLWLLVTAIVVARIPLFLFSGEFVGEDAWVFFAEAFNQGWTTSILTPYAGYFHLVPRLLAELLSILPTVTQPYAYAGLGISLNALIFSLFYLPRFRHLIAADGARVAVVLVLALAQNSENMGFLLGLHWYIAFLLPLLLVMEFPKGRAGRGVLYTTSVACVWSSPSTLVLVPVLLWQLITDKNNAAAGKWRWFTLVNLLVVAVFIALLRFRDAERTGVFVLSQIPNAIDRLVLRGWLGTGFLGQTISEVLVDTQPWLLDGLAILFFGILAKLMYDHKKSVAGQSAVLLLVSALLMIGLSMTRSLYLAELSEITLPRHVRYLTGPTLLLNLGALVLIFHHLKDKPIRLFYLTCVIQCLLLVSGLPRVNHWSRAPEMFRLRHFVSEIETFEKDYLQSGTAGILYVPSDVPYWGPVLSSGGKPPDPSETNFPADVASNTLVRPSFPSDMARFGTVRESNIIHHPILGRLTYDGVGEGRFWFRNTENKLLFTSELLYPYMWSMDGLRFELIKLE